jgi:S-adenosylmethionine:tRNA ribosyltransferase-isomerase
MLRRDFYFDLPSELIAQEPPERRGDSRLLLLDRVMGDLQDRLFADLEAILDAGDLLVLNNTRVIPARLFGAKSSGGRIEILIERLLEGSRVLAHIRASRAPKAGSRLRLDKGPECYVVGREGALFELCMETTEPLVQILERCGQIPLPPYIQRAPEDSDAERYQTVFAELPGAVAAPTAGLHFTPELLARLSQKGVEQGFITLHIGAGTFQSMRSERIEEHHMHSEWIEVNGQICEQIQRVQQRGGRIIAVGTTVARSLETAAQSGVLKPYQGETQLFIYPGYRFHVVDALLTNFHLPESTLLMLVAAFAGYENTLNAYRHAVAQRYRFFSYGDAMLIG